MRKSLSRRFRKPEASLRSAIVFALVLAVAIGGTATAGKLITGAQVKNGTLTFKDFKKSSLAKLQGPAGSQGAAGPVGPRGADGPSGPGGPSGAAGSTGASGPSGPTGGTGTQGATGATGTAGASGPSGAAGTNGTARAYAFVQPGFCSGSACIAQESQGITSVTRTSTGYYCVVATGIHSGTVPAAVSVEWSATSNPEGNASAMTHEGGCGTGNAGFLVVTERQPDTSATTVGPANEAGNVAFTILIP